MSDIMEFKVVTNKILIADDDSVNRMILKKGIKDMPYEFQFAVDGNDAWEKILTKEFELLLLDVEMPGFSGFELIQKLKDEFPDYEVPVLFMTGNSDRESINEGVSLGAVDYITKPYSMHEIRHRIQIHHDLYKGKKELDVFAKKMESLAEGRAQQLVHADRLATLGTMSAGIMHEINNPTTFISGNVQLLKNKFLPYIVKILENSEESESTKAKYIMEELPKMCDGILNGVSRIKKITDGLKAFSRSPSSGDELFSINHAISNSLFFCKSSVPKSMTLDYDEKVGLGTCMGDSQQLEQVIINLITNSSHALEDQSNPVISIRAEKKEDVCEIKVFDNGPGIPEHVLAKIWDPFFTTKAKGKGTGLGLSICKEIIEKHKGKIEYTGELGKGACFNIEIPLHKPQLA